MDKPSVRKLIREILSEEFAAERQRQGGAFADTTPVPQVCEEVVSINNDRELMLFVHHLLELSKDGRVRKEIESHRRVFRLGERRGIGGFDAGAPTSPALSGAEVAPARFDRGLVSEKHVNAIRAGTTKLVLGKRARITPLARDRARERGITIERFG